MSAGEAIADALDSLRAHKLRAGLSMLGMVFGAGAVIAMLAIGGGAERQAMEMIDRLGLRNVLIRSRAFKPEELQEIRKQSPGLSPRDAEAIVEAVPGVEFVAPRVAIEPYKVLAAGAKCEAKVYGVSHRHAELSSLRVAEGRFLDPLDEREHAQVAVMGPACAATSSASSPRSAGASRSTTCGSPSWAFSKALRAGGIRSRG